MYAPCFCPKAKVLVTKIQRVKRVKATEIQRVKRVKATEMAAMVEQI